MAVRAIAVLALASVWLVGASAAPKQSHARLSVELVPREQMIQAAMEVTKCAGKVTPDFSGKLCDSTWRGIHWTLYSKWVGEFDAPSGHWNFSCKYDAIYREDRCSFTSGLELSIIRSDGYGTLVNWGLRRFPGSAMIARFDGAAPISTTAETWTDAQSRLIYRRMMVGKIMRYRWFDWPANASHDTEVDLTNFADAAALMEAVRDEFTVQRVLGKIAVPK